MPAARTLALDALRRLIDDSQTRACNDEQLLQRFAGAGDEAAFEALLRRHGRMVLEVCASLLPNEADAEDAFQASFLLLAAKAKTIRKATSLAAWLHGVAYRMGKKAQTAFARRLKHQPAADARTTRTPDDDLTWREVRQVVHEELNGLSERFRQVLTLCYLEGKGQDQAAAELGIPKGTLKGRLERGRDLLRAQLVRRGLGPAGLLVALAWPAAGAAGTIPNAWVTATVAASIKIAAGKAIAGIVSLRVAELVKGGLNAMTLSKATAGLTAVGFIAAMTFVLSAMGWEDSERNGASTTPVAVDKADAALDVAPERAAEKLEWRKGKVAIPLQPGPVTAVAFSPDGKTLAIAVANVAGGKVKGEVNLYDTATGKRRGDFAGYAPLVFSPDGSLLACSDGGGSVQLWESAGPRQRLVFKGLSDAVLSIAFSPDGDLLAAGSGNASRPTNPGMVRLWHIADQVERDTGVHPGAVYAVSFSRDGKSLVSASSGLMMEIQSWNMPARDKSTTKGPGGRFLAVAVAPDGKRIATGMDAGETSDMPVKLWDIATGKELIKPLHHTQWIMAMAFSADGKVLATGNSEHLGEDRRTGVVHFWNTETGKELATLRGHKDEVRCLALGAGSTTLATGSSDGTVHLWELAASKKGEPGARAEPKSRPKLEEVVKVEFPKDGYTFTLAEAAKGIKIAYKITIAQDYEGVIPLPFPPSNMPPPGPSLLHPREHISGGGQLYCLMDFGLTPLPPKEIVKTLKKGVYDISCDWDGRNWVGPSDFSNPKGKPFPAGTYDLEVMIHGKLVRETGNVPYQIKKKTKLVLREGDPEKK